MNQKMKKMCGKMKRLIDADDLKDWAETVPLTWDGGIDINDFEEKLKSMPTIDAEPHWIPCSERLPENMEPVNITWVNRDPVSYYMHIKDKPFTATGIYYKGKWYWWSSTCDDILCEYGQNEIDEVDGGIEIVAWMPLPEPYEVEE